MRQFVGGKQKPLCLLAHARPHSGEAIIGWLADILPRIMEVAPHASHSDRDALYALIGRKIYLVENKRWRELVPDAYLDSLNDAFGLAVGNRAPLPFEPSGKEAWQRFYSLLGNKVVSNHAIFSLAFERPDVVCPETLSSHLSAIGKLASETNNIFLMQDIFDEIRDIGDPAVRNQIWVDLYLYAQRTGSMSLKHEAFGHLDANQQASFIMDELGKAAGKADAALSFISHPFEKIVRLVPGLTDEEYSQVRLKAASALLDASGLSGEEREGASLRLLSQLDSWRASGSQADAASSARSMIKSVISTASAKPPIVQEVPSGRISYSKGQTV